MGKFSRIVYVLLAGVVFCACNDDNQLPVVTPSASGTFTDERDGAEYGWIRLGNQEWMTSNLKYGEPYYEQEYEGGFVDNVGEPQDVDTMEAAFDYEGDIEKNGNLYTWGQALEAAPAGWRLPTDEDWQALEAAVGMDAGELATVGKRGSVQGELMQQGEEGTGLALELGGYYISDEDDARFMTVFTYESVYGFYWTATLDESKAEENFAYYRQIFYNSPQVERNSMTKLNLLSVRCVRDAGAK